MSDGAREGRGANQRPAHPATVVQPKVPHAATVQRKGLLPHPATTTRPVRPPHPATVAQAKPALTRPAAPPPPPAIAVQRPAGPPRRTAEEVVREEAGATTGAPAQPMMLAGTL